MLNTCEKSSESTLHLDDEYTLFTLFSLWIMSKYLTGIVIGLKNLYDTWLLLQLNIHFQQR